jgi:hypothetical protein
MLNPFVAIDLAATYQQDRAEERFHCQLLRQANVDQAARAEIFWTAHGFRPWSSLGERWSTRDLLDGIGMVLACLIWQQEGGQWKWHRDIFNSSWSAAA